MLSPASDAAARTNKRMTAARRPKASPTLPASTAPAQTASGCIAPHARTTAAGPTHFTTRAGRPPMALAVDGSAPGRGARTDAGDSLGHARDRRRSRPIATGLVDDLGWAR